MGTPQDLPRADKGVAAALADGVAVFDLSGRIQSVNASASRLLGLPSDELVSRVLTDDGWRVIFEDGTQWPVDEMPMRIAAETGRPVIGVIMGVDRNHAGTIWLQVSAVPYETNGAVSHVIVSFSDVTRELDSRNELLSMFEESVIGVCLSDLDGTYLRINPALRQILGRDPLELLAHTDLDFIHPDDAERARTDRAALLDGRIRSSSAERRYLRPDGTMVWTRVNTGLLRGVDGAVTAVISQVEDITGQTAAAEQLRWLAFHDALTGLPNRSLLLDRVQHALARAQRTDTGVGALFLDLDRFKLINDTLGHAAGDRLLEVVAQRLRDAVRDDDTVARLGGDEFVVLAEGLGDSGEIMRVARRIQQSLEIPVEVGGRTLSVQASIGIALAEDFTNTGPESLLRDADTALYRAKERGRNRCELFDETLRLEAIRKLTAEEILRSALQDDGLTVHYQPVVDLTTCTMTGVEALLRLNGADGRLQAPGDFIGIAEESGLIVQIGAGVLDTSCAQLAAWRDEFGPDAPRHVAVNVSARQLSLASFTPLVERILRIHGLSPHDLILEFTEGVIVEADEQTTQTVASLHRLGVSLAVDDFGTGYSSLSYLKRFPVDIVKLDRSFVDGYGRDASDTAIVNAVIALGRSLGLSVTAEGIETPEQLQALRELGCDHGQGYFLARPSAAADVSALIRAPQWSQLFQTSTVG